MMNKFRVQKDKMLLDYIVFMAMFSNYVEHIIIWYMALVGFFIIFLTSVKDILGGIKSIFLLLIADFLLLFCSGMVSESSVLCISNSLNILVPLLIVISLSLLNYHNPESFRKNIYSKIKLFNFWWILNIIIVIIQLTGNSIFIKTSWIIQNPLYKDLCCGLFGYNRTHELAFYSCMMFVCNLSYLEYMRKEKRYIFLIYTIFTQIVMLICSFFNDNTALFILMPVVLVMYVILIEIKKRHRLLIKIWNYTKYILLVGSVFIIALKIPEVKEVFDDYVMVRLEAIMKYQVVGVAGSNERSAIVEYALNQKETWAFGVGYWNETLGEHSAHGFRHFGINSMGSFLYLCGIWFFGVHILTISRSISSFMKSNSALGKFIINIMVISFMILVSFYSPMLISSASLIWICFMFVFI